MSRRLLAAVSTGIAFAVAQAQPSAAKPDPLVQAQIARDLADQKAESQVADAIKEADKLARVSALKAINLLKQEQLGLDLSVTVSSGKRSELTKTIQAKIDAWKGAPTATPDDAARVATKGASEKIAAAMRAETKEVNEEVAKVSALIVAGRTREAEAKAAALLAKYPDNPAAIVLAHKGTMTENVAAARAMTKMHDERVLYAFNDLYRSSMPAKGDIEFPKDWQKKTAGRSNKEELSPEMKSLLEALDKPVNVPVAGLQLGEALQALSNAMDKPFAVDEESLKALDIDLKKPVSFNPGNKPLTARTVLRGLLQSQQLTFVVKDNLIQVVTIEKARTMLVTKAYYLGDIVQGWNGGAVRWGALLDYEQTKKNADFLIEAIKVQVDPYVWKGEGGGPGSITFHFPSMSMIVRAPAEVQATLGNKFTMPK